MQSCQACKLEQVELLIGINRQRATISQVHTSKAPFKLSTVFTNCTGTPLVYPGRPTTHAYRFRRLLFFCPHHVWTASIVLLLHPHTSDLECRTACQTCVTWISVIRDISNSFNYLALAGIPVNSTNYYYSTSLLSNNNIIIFIIINVIIIITNKKLQLLTMLVAPMNSTMSTTSE